MTKTICTFNPAEFDSFIKVISTLEDHDVITVENSQICQATNRGSAILKADLTGLIGQGVNIHILNPKKYVKLFKNIQNKTDNIEVLDDSDNERYIVQNSNVKVLLPKQSESISNSLTPPNFSNVEKIGENVELDKEAIKTIKPLLGYSDHIDLLVKDDQFKGIFIPETAVYLFPDYKSDDVNENNADISLKSYSFLSIDAEDYEIYLGKDDQKDKYWLYSDINTGYLHVELYEDVSKSGNDDMLI